MRGEALAKKDDHTAVGPLGGGVFRVNSTLGRNPLPHMKSDEIDRCGVRVGVASQGTPLVRENFFSSGVAICLGQVLRVSTPPRVSVCRRRRCPRSPGDL